MLNQIVSLGHSALRSVDMTPNQWMAACGVLMLVGFLCLRGFGSRTKY